MTKHVVNYGDKVIYFELKRKNVKNINLSVRPDMSIGVSANDNVPLESIKEFVQEKGSWILKNIDYFKQFKAAEKPKIEYVSGESIKYLGKQYRLKVRKSEREMVKYFRGFIYIYVKDTKDFNTKEKLFKDWLHEKTQIHFEESLDRMYELAKNLNIPKPKLKIRDMKARWGSCHIGDKIIIINSELIKAPKHCIDYVILHELLHFKYKNHNKNFYTLLTTLMPDWENRKKILDEEVIMDL